LFEQALRGERNDERKPFDPRSDRKTLQLCRQVQRSLMLALGGECGDDLLREVFVDSVEPVDGAGHLLVRVNVPANLSVLDVLVRLNERSGKLRAVVAGSICRKRVPMLSFTAATTWEGGDHE
jgi:ribosome-binding factor A